MYWYANIEPNEAWTVTTLLKDTDRKRDEKALSNPEQARRQSLEREAEEGEAWPRRGDRARRQNEEMWRCEDRVVLEQAEVKHREKEWVMCLGSYVPNTRQKNTQWAFIITYLPSSVHRPAMENPGKC